MLYYSLLLIVSITLPFLYTTKWNSQNAFCANASGVKACY